jgi:hypothetical protein
VKPSNNKLSTLCQFFTGKELEGNHRALEDVKALYVVFRQPAMWNRRAFHVGFNKERHPLPPLPDNDSDNDNESDNESESLPVSLSLSEEEVGTLMEDVAPVGDCWSEGEFQPQRRPYDLFEAHFKSTNRSGRTKTGIQVPPAYANSPIKAWRLIFTNTILERIVKHTNNYGELKARQDKWSSVERKDLINFFVSSLLWVYRKEKTNQVIEIRRPTVISEYNKYMGGVDVADMRRRHCSSTIMGQNRWWLKLFFYLLDVGTSIALVLYNEAMKSKQKPMNTVEFKTRLVESVVGARLEEQAGDLNRVIEHAMVQLPGDNRQKCSYCALTGTQRRTRFMYKGCSVPFFVLEVVKKQKIVLRWLTKTSKFEKSYLKNGKGSIWITSTNKHKRNQTGAKLM